MDVRQQLARWTLKSGPCAVVRRAHAPEAEQGSHLRNCGRMRTATITGVQLDGTRDSLYCVSPIPASK
eukprot:5038267-Pyramimonas_sp.AAC.1